VSDVWKELEERLKQKAFERHELPEWVLRRHKWVKLEDAKKELQQLKQNYIVIEKKKFKDLFRWLKGNINLNYGGRNQEQLLRWVDELEELLRENES